ncbi:MAG: hypothetical protein JSV30_06555 [Candidatus Omnitrophota bacterium]|nr:MAG: hypothetical protein JSV30_06555 [Candidatus Omnitrophota bacterium]
MGEKRPLNPVEELRRDKLEKLKKCFSELEGYKRNKLTLQYPVFFVPGWTCEDCAAWKKPYEKIPKKYKEYYKPAKYWIDEIIENKEQAHFIEFTDQESKDSPSFMKLGEYLKKKLIAITQERPINLVGHSMGGLDIRSAISDVKEPALNTRNVITVGTPNNGTLEAGLLNWKFVQDMVKKFKKMKDYHIIQGCNLYRGSNPIREINEPKERLNLLEKIDKFYVFMGLRDSTVKSSPKLKKDGISEDLYEEKVKIIQTASAEHSGKDGITQDPRLFLPIIKILCGIELKDDFNHGYIYRKET